MRKLTQKTISADLKVGEKVVIGSVTVTLLEKSGQRARLRITADSSVRVDLPRRASTGAAQAIEGLKSP